MKTYLIISFFFLGVFLSNGQTYSSEEETGAILSNQDLVKKNILKNSYLSDIGVGVQKNTRNEIIEGNRVFVTQIGDFNTASLSIKSEASEIKVNQEGNNNFTGLEYNVKTAITDIEQRGNDNQVLDIVRNSQANISLDLTQQGDNLNFQRLGSNSLTESLQFVQTAASPSLIIRSKTYGNSDN